MFFGILGAMKVAIEYFRLGLMKFSKNALISEALIDCLEICISQISNDLYGFKKKYRIFIFYFLSSFILHSQKFKNYSNNITTNVSVVGRPNLRGIL